MLLTLLCNGNALLEGLPGLAKTYGLQLKEAKAMDPALKYRALVDNAVDVVDITDVGTIIPKESVTMRVRTLGVAFQSGSRELPLDAYWSVNNSSWSRFFYDVGSNVVSTDILIETNVKKGDQINFGARGKNGSIWYPFHHTAKDDRYVIVLKNGDKAPSYAPAYNQSGVESFLSPYIDGSGRIRIGPRDVIVLWEASTASPGSTYFDMQDLVVLATFE